MKKVLTEKETSQDVKDKVASMLSATVVSPKDADLVHKLKASVGKEGFIGSKVGSLLKELTKNLMGISREFQRSLHAFLIISIRNSCEIPKSML
jgi:hypothetical protein